ncbi:5,10-methylenetetrahydrofolate reductase [Corynebacterium yudongzhengii]|uniref:Methylenetetrahydrofolate reductase n=1 Tax=Corynebacterium yudongzhengii TaxID=2080740 RepID=A0A2U1T546_9CORY|nr:methylenetetrahydrofolate reductase [Corynebacterium yudongzhengii]AWB80950.1 5,10-methylenetetrahydrofolate reductase [Corynebacterium yudongzhengii]PWC01124.1 5,10-methylenetetrahydrofolate reductase [Corynebacterium yudongzhengii]
MPTRRQAAPRLSASAPVDSGEQASSSTPHWDRLALSFEVIPPRAGNTADVEKLDGLLAELESYRPDYLAVTSSQRSGWLKGTTALIEYITETTRMRPLAHIACTTGDRAAMVRGINELIDAGVRGLLALRGDLPEGESSLPPGYLQHATDLIRLIRDVERGQAARFAAGNLAVGVACYPSGHFESANEDEDFDVLLAKQRLGADFAITQLFFEAEDYLRFVKKARLAGVTIPLIPGIMPMTSAKRLERMGKLAGLSVPEKLAKQLNEAALIGPDAEWETGLELTVQLAREVLEGGAGGLHVYTHNKIDVTRELLTRVGIHPKQPMRRMA